MRSNVRVWLGILAAACAALPAMAEPSDTPRRVRVDIEELLAYGTPLPAEGQEATIPDFLYHLAQDPKDVGAHINLGNLYAREGKFDLAERAYHRAIRLNDRHPIAWNNLGVLYLRLGEVNQAVSCFREALDQDEKYAVARYNLASIQDSRGDYDGAVENFRVAIALRPELAQVKANPYVVNNRHVVTVSLLNYLDREIYSMLTEKASTRLVERVVGIAEPVPARRR